MRECRRRRPDADELDPRVPFAPEGAPSLAPAGHAARSLGTHLVHFLDERVLIRAGTSHSVGDTMTTHPMGPRAALAALRDRRSKALGRRGEDLAAAHFERLGYHVLARNHRTRFGELDLVLADAEDRTIVFCEVKTRRAGSSGVVWDNLHAAKRRKVRTMSAAWLAEVHDRPWAAELRFDAVGIELDARDELVQLDHLEAAF